MKTLRLGLLAGCLLAGTITFAPTAAVAAPTVNAIEINSPTQTVTTSTGHKLLFKLHAEKDTFGGQSTVLLSNVLATTNHDESHGWTLPAKSPALTTTSKNHAVLSLSASRLGPFGVIHLTFTPTSKPTTQMCEGQAVSRTIHGTLAGKFDFNTRSGTGGWGTVGSKTKKFTFAKASHLIYDYDGPDFVCPSSYTAVIPCFKGISFRATETGPMDGSKPNGATYGPISATGEYDYKTLQVTRQDFISGQASMTTGMDTGGHEYLVIRGKVRSGGRLTIPSVETGPGNSTTGKCGKNNSGSETRTTWAGIAYNASNAQGGGLALDQQIFGKISVPDNANLSDFEIDS